jgi:hypothetical protein
MRSRTVTTAPVKVPATGITGSLAVTRASGLPSTETSATASPWTRTATSAPRDEAPAGQRDAFGDVHEAHLPVKEADWVEITPGAGNWKIAAA